MIRHKGACIAFFLVLFVVSVVYIDPYTGETEPEEGRNRSLVNSSALVMKTIAEKDRVITRFEDADGNLTYADDLRYAFKTVTKTSTGEYEAYFDEQGKPAKNTSGYYGVLRQYDEKNKTEKITYYGENNQVIMTVEGFAVICQKYDESGNVIVDSISSLDWNMKNTKFSGAINSTGNTTVSVGEGSTWTLTGDSTVSSLEVSGNIEYGDYSITVNGQVYNSSNPFKK